MQKEIFEGLRDHKIFESSSNTVYFRLISISSIAEWQFPEHRTTTTGTASPAGSGERFWCHCVRSWSSRRRTRSSAWRLRDAAAQEGVRGIAGFFDELRPGLARTRFCRMRSWPRPSRACTTELQCQAASPTALPCAFSPTRWGSGRARAPDRAEPGAV